MNTAQDRLRRRKAVAPIIATLLLVAIAVVGGIIVFVWASGIFGSTAGTALPTAESLQLIGYDARDVADLTGLTAIDNTPDQKLDASATANEYVVMEVRNTGVSDMLIGDIDVMGVTHTWDAAANVTTPPGAGQYEVYEALTGDPSTDKTTPGLAPGEDARIVLRLGDLPGDQVNLGRNLQVKIKTEQSQAFNFFVVTGQTQ